jgi:membrane AbrB-like protein
VSAQTLRALALQWGVLLALSAALVLLLEAVRLPAALLLGPMVAGIIIAAARGAVRVPDRPFLVAQAVLGCMVARNIPLSVVAEMARHWPLFLAGIVSVIAASSTLGFLLARWRVLPGTTAVWGTSPGAATTMVLMADAYGADMRLVAFMQYLRVVCVALAATAVARIFVGAPGGVAPAAVAWFPPIAWWPFAQTLALVALGAVVAPRLRVPAGPMLLPLGAGTLLQDLGLVTIELPAWLLAISYAMVGWSIGLRFTRPILAHAARALPRVLAAIVALIASCGLLAAALVAAGVDPLTAYLATSPGGADSVAIIAASSAVDLPFVMAMQTVRFLVVLFVGPRIARFVADRTRPR